MDQLDAPVVAEKTFTQSEVESMIKARTDREREQLRLKHEENERLKSKMQDFETKLQDLQEKVQTGTATTDETQQLQTAKTAAQQGAREGYSEDELKNIVSWEMQKQAFTNKLMDANKKDPEFSKLVKEGQKLEEHEVMGLAYLPNGTAVLKQLLKDPKALAVYRAGIQNAPNDNGVAAMTYLNSLSDRIGATTEKPAPSSFQPAEQLSDASDEDQGFDETDYVSKNY